MRGTYEHYKEHEVMSTYFNKDEKERILSCLKIQKSEWEDIAYAPRSEYTPRSDFVAACAEVYQLNNLIRKVSKMEASEE